MTRRSLLELIGKGAMFSDAVECYCAAHCYVD
jgi:hypothetical protein